MANPGWYPDPSNSQQLRWWDGSQWTTNTHPLVEQSAPSTAVSEPIEAKPTETKPADQVARHLNESKVRLERGQGATVGSAAWVGLVALIKTVIVMAGYWILTGWALIFLARRTVTVDDIVPLPLLIGIFVVGAGSILLLLFLLGRFTASGFTKRGWRFASRWNLIVAYPVAGLITGIIFIALGFILGLILSAVNIKDSAIVTWLVPLLYLIVLIYFVGRSFVWVSGWNKTLAKVLVLLYVFVSLGSLIVSLIFFSSAGGIIDQVNQLAGKQVSAAQVKKIKLGTRRAVVERKLGKPFSVQNQGPLNDCLIYRSSSQQLAIWALCFKGKGDQARLVSKKELSSQSITELVPKGPELPQQPKIPQQPGLPQQPTVPQQP